MSFGLSTSQTQPSLGSGYQVISSTSGQPKDLPPSTQSEYMGHTVASQPAQQQYMQPELSQHDGSASRQSSGAYKIETVPHVKMQQLVSQSTESTAKARMDEVFGTTMGPVSYTHLRAHETQVDLVCRLLLALRLQTTESTYVLHKSSQHTEISSSMTG